MTGQFLSVDPEFNATLDAYGYADENPLDGNDGHHHQDGHWDNHHYHDDNNEGFGNDRNNRRTCSEDDHNENSNRHDHDDDCTSKSSDCSTSKRYTDSNQWDHCPLSADDEHDVRVRCAIAVFGKNGIRPRNRWWAGDGWRRCGRDTGDSRQ